MILMIVVLKKSQTFKRDLKHLFSHPIELIVIIIAGYVITINWGTFIWAVSNGHVLQSSLGYYINPLVSILLAFIFLKERFNKFETLAIIFATIGVLYMTIRVGEFPVISLMLAFSFGIYGLLKKIVKIEAISSIAIECIVTAPAGLIYMIYLWNTGTSSVGLNMDILVDVLRCSNCHSINLILSRCQTYSVISNRIHSIRWSNNHVLFRHLRI